MIKLNPTARIALALALLTLSILLVAEVIGLVPNKTNLLAAERAASAESLAVHLSGLADQDNYALVDHTIGEFVRRNDDVLSAALRMRGNTVSSHGLHVGYWKPDPSGNSTLTHVQVPLLKDQTKWANVEVRFKPVWGTSIGEYLLDTSFGLYGFIFLTSLTLFYLFLRRALDELNPAKVIPERVRAAFDTMAEGVLVLDQSDRIVLANTAFASRVDIPPDKLIGKKPSHFNWLGLAVDEAQPWQTVATSGVPITAQSMKIVGSGGTTFNFMVNAGPVTDPKGNVRGVILTFDDVTETEAINHKLSASLVELEQSRSELEGKNVELEKLATLDPLTGCLNRRALFSRFERLFAAAQEKQTALGCLMIDIDHFKRVNDTYGHAVGDVVIQSVGEVLKRNLSQNDLAARYGGEEFCAVVPGGAGIELLELAERLRRDIATVGTQADLQSLGLYVTASVGVAYLDAETKDVNELVNFTDQALYQAKRTGRNRVCDYLGDGVGSVAHDDGNATTDETDNPTTLPLPAQEHAPATGDFVNNVVQLQRKVEELQGLADQRAREVWHHSLHDPITSLPNRVLLLDRANQAVKRVQRQAGLVVAVSIEIPTIKSVRDSFGSRAGDALQVAIAERLTDMVRRYDTLSTAGPDQRGDTISSVGIDEYVMLLTEIDDLTAATQVVRRVRAALGEAFALANGIDEELYLSGAIGVGICPHDARDAETLLRHASSARRQSAKSSPNLSVVYYSDEINTVALKQLRIETSLQTALDKDQFEVHYQPKFDASSRVITGIEALVRWRSPDLGYVEPLEFIPIAESGGLMPKLTDWVLREVCMRITQWRALGVPLRVAVNLSATELHDAGVADRILRTLDQLGVATSSLEIEITETSAIENIDSAVDVLKRLRDAGVRVALDDFGTGYSSLNHLSKLPLDVLKIDRCFVRGIDHAHENSAIVPAILAMARASGLKVVAEGVETEAELQELKRLGIEEAQGYLFSEALSAQDVAELIVARTAPAAKTRKRWMSSR